MGDAETAALPPGWAWAKLGDISAVSGGLTKNRSRDTSGMTNVPFLRVANVQLGYVDLKDLHLIQASTLEVERLSLQRGDLLVVEGNGSLSQVGRCAIWESDLSGCIHQNHIIRVRLNKPEQAAWVFRWLSSQHGRTFIERSANSTSGLHTLSISKVESLPVPIAPEREQGQIMRVLGSSLDDIGDVEAAMKRARGQMADYRASLVHAACTGALTADWRAANPHPAEDGSALLRRILAERRADWERAELVQLTAGDKIPRGEAWKRRYPEPVAVTGELLHPLPSSWTWASLDQLTSLITSGSRAWSSYYGRGTGTFIMAQNVRSGRFNPSPRQPVDPPPDDPERSRTEVKLNDILVTIVGANTGNSCRINTHLVENYVCQSVGLLRPVIAETSAFFEVYMTAPSGAQARFKEMMYGAGRPHLSFDQLRSIPIPLPPLHEQSQVAVEMRDHAIDDTSEETGSVSVGDEFADLRQSILHAAFSGRLVPQDPADEPAAALIARLRAEAATPAPRRRTARTKAPRP